MQSTADKILSAWIGHKKSRTEKDTYTGNCPYRIESDSGAFSLKIDDGEHGAYFDHARKESGSLYDLAQKMNIEIPQNGRNPVQNTKTGYDGLEEYAKRHFAPVSAFLDAKWSERTVKNRPALVFPTQSGEKARFIDGKKPRSLWVGENEGNCWYGLDRAITRANQISSALVLCNGEPSTVVAQHYGIPAFAGTGGEGAVSDEMLSELKRRWSGQIIIALDCDTQGINASQALAEKFDKPVVIDLGLGEGGDLADFCGLHELQAMDMLKRLAKDKLESMQVEIAEFIEFHDNTELLSTFQRFVWDDPTLFGRVIKMPFEAMRQSGGFADMITTKKVWFIGNVSGGGKTIWSETLCDAWNQLGYNVFYIGDEWTEMEFVARQVQRASLGTTIPYMDYLRYAIGEKVISDSELDSTTHAIRAIRSRRGKTYVMKVNENSRQVVFLEDIMQALGEKIDILRHNGVTVDVVILDYLSLYDTRSENSGNNIEEYKAGIFKSWCKSLDVLGVSTVQVNKQAEDRVTHKGGFLTQHDLHWIRPDKGNLISTMNRVLVSNYEYHDDVYMDNPKARAPYIDENGNPIVTPNICMVTAKNSVASPHEYTYFHFDYAHMKICEGVSPDYHYDKVHHLVLPNNHPKAHKNVISPHFSDTI